MPSPETWTMSEESCYVGLTFDHLSVKDAMDRVRSPQAGAIVVFVGTTRDNFDGKTVKELQYSAYNKMALRTMMSICREMVANFGLNGISMIHRLGSVPIGEESIVIAVSSPHRKAAWEAGEEALEQCKAKVQVWKREEFDDGEGVWRANRDGAKGVKVEETVAAEPGSSHETRAKGEPEAKRLRRTDDGRSQERQLDADVSNLRTEDTNALGNSPSSPKEFDGSGSEPAGHELSTNAQEL
ncbi:Molybdopterin synthase catalytic subunit [Ceratocystis platani]|uniref:Molybdopterin synthase catalytic subunit n=1 Tax=Ceratocystis fimbriata f. sp. platani TaxID=88771 RepID=A0A0F8D1Q3_CERFI|nr:Molybdopterin synthase catalytic subunit [Ceratocystis platani]